MEVPPSELTALKRRFDAMKIGFGGGDYSLLIGPPFMISQREFERLQGFGRLYAQLFNTVNRLYLDSVKQLKQPGKRSTVLKLLEGGLDDRAVWYQHRLYEGKPVRLPVFMRADMLSLDRTVELNIPGSGLGWMDSMDGYAPGRRNFGCGLARGWAEGLKRLTGKERPRVALPLYSEDVRNELNHFAGALSAMGVETLVYGRDLPDPAKVDVIVRFSMNYMTSRPGWNEIWDAYMAGKLEIEPPPTSIYDTKIPFYLPFFSETRSAFPDAMRELFPRTWLVEPEGKIPLIIGGVEKEVDVERIPDLPGKERELVIKYAGSKSALGGGGRAVFQLDGSREGARKLIQQALRDLRLEEDPWVIQERLKKYFDVEYLTPEGGLSTARMHARIMPYYRLQEGQVVVDGGSVLFSENWKVHGAHKSVHCPIRVTE
ncbi:MAG: hypothetical protein V1703_04620 [Candidatus Altiarchaeota archaeon]